MSKLNKMETAIMKEVLKKYPKLKEEKLNYTPFKVIDYLPDPEFDGVVLLQIKLDDYGGEFGLCIFDNNKGSFIEEPGMYEEYNLTLEEVEKKFKFKH